VRYPFIVLLERFPTVSHCLNLAAALLRYITVLGVRPGSKSTPNDISHDRAA